MTTLYGITVPNGNPQVVRYDDGTGDELPVPLGTTAFVSGKTMFDILPAESKSLAVRAKVKYAPHPYVWMAPARAMPTGLGIESEGLELPLSELPDWEEERVKVFPLVSRFFLQHLAITLAYAGTNVALEKSSNGGFTFPSSPMWRARAPSRSSSSRREA